MKCMNRMNHNLHIKISRMIEINNCTKFADGEAKLF